MCYLLDVYTLDTTQLTKYNWTEEIHQQRAAEEENRKYLLKPIRDSLETRNKSLVIESLMADEYKEMKKHFGVTNKPKENLEETKNN